MLLSCFFIRASAVLSIVGGLVVLGVSIDMSDLESALYSIPFFAASALLWGFSDVIKLLHGIHAATVIQEAGAVKVEPVQADRPPRSADEIAKDLQRMKASSGA